MRPIVSRQGALRHPLNRLLGTEANVRLLRTLSSSDGPLSPSRLAEATGLHLSGVTRAIASLEATGIVEMVGAGSRRPVAFRRAHPLAEAVAALFQAERTRVDTILLSIGQAARELRPAPTSVWVEGAFVRDEDGPDDALVVGVLGSARDIDAMVVELYAALETLVRDHDLPLDVRGRTAADLSAATETERALMQDALPVLGPPPNAVWVGAPARRSGATRAVAERRLTHEELDARSLAFGREIAERLRGDATLVDRARRYIAARIPQASEGEQRELRAWERILSTRSVPGIRRFLVDRGELATRLRQTMPFVGVLRSEERAQIVEAARDPEPVRTSRVSRKAPARRTRR